MFVRVFTNLLIFLTLAGTSYAIYLAVDNAEAKVHRRDFHEAFNSGTEGIVLFMASFQVGMQTTTFMTFLSLSLRSKQWSQLETWCYPMCFVWQSGWRSSILEQPSSCGW